MKYCRMDARHADVTAEVLECLGELADVGGTEMVRSQDQVSFFVSAISESFFQILDIQIPPQLHHG